MKTESGARKEFSRLIGRLVRNLSLLDRDQKVCRGITLSQCYTIETLARRGTLSMKALSHEMGVTISTMTRVIDVLVRDGVVAREASPEDRRRVCVGLTDKGLDLARRLGRCSDDYSKQILSRIPSARRKDVLTSLGLLADATETVRDDKCKCAP
ncbi:MAG: MarR family transcriptional regulator [Candidatus Eisenbacteria bacterium]